MSRSSRYILVQYGYLNRDERLNIGLLAWDVEGTNFTDSTCPPETLIRLRLIRDWTRIDAAFPRMVGAKEDVIRRLEAIITKEDLDKVIERMGPYTPFHFRDPYPSTISAANIIDDLYDHFLGDNQ